MSSLRLHPQVDGTTCGIAALAALAARAGRLPEYETATPEQVRQIQKRLHRVASRTGVSWPQALGTSPWALAKLARGTTGVPYRVLPWSDRAVSLLDQAIASDADSFLYVGDSGQPVTALVPRHVVLVLGAESAATPGTVAIFEPSTGRMFRVARQQLLTASSGPVAAFGNWRRVLLLVAPVNP